MAEFGPVTCAGCALLCDDVLVSDVNGGARLRPECPRGATWFSERVHRAGGPAAAVMGQPVDVDGALTRAAELLRGARRPLLHGFDGATVEDARAAVALADRLGALVATRGIEGPWPGAPAVPLRGASTATLGEIRDRSRLVVIWREDPERTHPRLLERLGFGSPSEERVLVVVDDRETATAGRADVRLHWPRERDLEALVALHVLQRGLDVGATSLAEIHERLSAVPHAALVYGPGLTAGPGGQRRALALNELVRDLSHDRHVVTLELPRDPGTRGADDVLAWQSGYSGNVDFAGGHPELVTATQPLDAFDLRLLVESRPEGEAEGASEIAIGCLPPQAEAEVWIRTAAAGIAAGGTAHRLDGVPLALQAPRPDDAPTAAAVLTWLLEAVHR